MLRTGIIGCGGITERRHGPMLASLKGRVTVAALADLAQERLDLMGGKLGVASQHLYTDWEEMLANEKLELVHICTPHDLHEPPSYRRNGEWRPRISRKTYRYQLGRGR